MVEAAPTASIADLLRFTLPTLGIWLIGPILSLADTAFVGSQVSPTASTARLLACCAVIIGNNQTATSGLCRPGH